MYYRNMKLIFCLIMFGFVGSAYANNPAATGDVLGRDLNVPLLGGLGHVGMWTGGNVLEVLDSGSVIQNNSLANFKSRSKYWGARYRNFSALTRVINAGNGQKSYKPKYTLSPFWTEGHYQSYRLCFPFIGCKTFKRLVRAKFRCDSFVRYSYSKGLGTAPTLVLLTKLLPSSTWAWFTYRR